MNKKNKQQQQQQNTDKKHNQNIKKQGRREISVKGQDEKKWNAWYLETLYPYIATYAHNWLSSSSNWLR